MDIGAEGGVRDAGADEGIGRALRTTSLHMVFL